MIHYQLRCTTAAEPHEFDGWFKDSAAFDRQARAGLVECPACGGTKVDRALMAPAIPKKGRPVRNAPVSNGPAEAEAPAAPPPVPAPSPAHTVPAAAGPMPAQLRALLSRMRAEVEQHCDYVGPGFAEEARKIHHGESEARGIYGETTDAEAEALQEEGIEFARLPWVPPSDA